jgi:hypothetical protein
MALFKQFCNKKVYQTDWIVEGIIQQIEVVKKAFDDVGITDDV